MEHRINDNEKILLFKELIVDSATKEKHFILLDDSETMILRIQRIENESTYTHNITIGEHNEKFIENSIKQGFKKYEKNSRK